MACFLFKPHVAVSLGVTSPDLVIDALAHQQAWQPLRNLSSSYELALEAGESTHCAIALTSAGGGLLISPALVSNLGRYCVARCAWRYSSVHDRGNDVTLNGEPIASLLEQSTELQFAGFIDSNLPRGVMLILESATTSTMAELADTNGRDALQFKPAISLPGDGATAATRSLPRYAIGPTKEKVTHYL